MTPDESWNTIKNHLEAAYQQLPRMRTTNCAFPYAENDFKEFLADDELEYALDCLEEIGEVNDLPYEYWQHLCEAASSLGLYQHKGRYEQIMLRISERSISGNPG